MSLDGAQESDFTQVRTIVFPVSWFYDNLVNLARSIKAVTFLSLGRGFGQVIKPAEPNFWSYWAELSLRKDTILQAAYLNYTK
jgi:hypothetical protein